MKKREIITDEKHQVMMIESKLKEIKEHISWGILPLNPTRIFNVGDNVKYGCMKDVLILESFENGLYYKILCKGINRNKFESPRDEIQLVEWIDIFPLTTKFTNFTKKERCFIRLSNTSIDALLHRIYNPGVDFDVEYQRDHVWNHDDKISLIESIFNNIDIGKFVFVQRDFSTEGKLYEILDGKQRLTTLKEFYEDRFKYNGYYYSELSFEDQWKIKNHDITVGTLENPDKRTIFETFIKLNTCGRPMENKDVEKVKKLLNELKDCNIS